MLLRLVMGSAHDGQTCPQVPGVALSHSSDRILQAIAMKRPELLVSRPRGGLCRCPAQ